MNLKFREKYSKDASTSNITLIAVNDENEWVEKTEIFNDFITRIKDARPQPHCNLGGSPNAKAVRSMLPEKKRLAGRECQQTGTPRSYQGVEKSSIFTLRFSNLTQKILKNKFCASKINLDSGGCVC